MAVGQIPLELEVSPWAFLTSRRTPWWLETECWVLGLIAFSMLWLAPLETPLSMPEATIGRAAREMLLSGDWVVPRCQEVPIPQIAPLQVWLIAIVATIQGDVDAWSIRLPTLLAFWLTVQLLYAYCRQFIGTVGSLGAGLMFLTTVGVQMQSGVGSALPITAFFLTFALLVWHIGWMEDWPDLIQWVVPYLTLALAILSSGIFPAVVFGSSLACYLFLRRKEEYAITLGHLAGLLLCGGLVGSWVLTYSVQTGINPWWAGSSNPLGQSNPLWALLEHLVTFPLLVAATMLLPWGLLLVVYLFDHFRRHLGDARPAVQFLSVCLLIPGALMWVDPRSTPAAALLLLPGISVLTAIVVQRSVEAYPTSDWQFIWPTFLRWMVTATIGGLAVAFAAKFFLPEKFASLPWDVLNWSLAALIVLAIVIGRSTGRHPRPGLWAMGAVALLMTLTIAPPIRAFLQPPLVAHVPPFAAPRPLAGQMPEISLGAIRADVLLKLDQPLPRQPWPQEHETLDVRHNIFCFMESDHQSRRLPFSWKLVSRQEIVPTPEFPQKQWFVIGQRSERAPGGNLSPWNDTGDNSSSSLPPGFPPENSVTRQELLRSL